MTRPGPRISAPPPGGPGLRRPGFILAPGQRVGLYGGSFDPIHAGHVHVARTATRRLRLDRVIWLVAPRNPLKPMPPSAVLADRFAAMSRKIKDPRAIVSDLEARVGAAHTAHTVRMLKRRFPAVRFVWIMGADSLADFHRWWAWTALAREAPIAVVARPGHGLRGRFSPFGRRFAAARLPASAAATLASRRPPAWIYLTAPLHPHASTALRAPRRQD